MVAQIPGHYLMQKLPLGRFVTISVFLWSVVVFLHCTAKSYGGLIPLRFFLGFFESCLVPAMEVTMGMFFTPVEAVRYQPLFWTSCLASPIPAGFIAYGLLHIQSKEVLPWKFFSKHHSSPFTAPRLSGFGEFQNASRRDPWRVINTYQ